MRPDSASRWSPPRGSWFAVVSGDLANPFVNIPIDRPLALPSTDQFSEAGHQWSRPEQDALILAYAARRPLLVRGEAGCGKSQIARAAARALGGAQPLVEVIHPRFEALDLLWRLDAVERLADAQLNALDVTNRKYVKKGRLWEAIEQAASTGRRTVLLIDEIDKADADLPNSLLGVLGNRSFAVSPLGNEIVRAHAELFPLIVVTTNEERELPAAFVRRCVVLNLSPPNEDAEFTSWLVERGRVHEHLTIEDAVRERAAQQVLADRRASVAEGYPPVGLAEYIDLLSALHELTVAVPQGEKLSAQSHWLDRLSAYALIKHAGQSQIRPAIGSPSDGEKAC